MIRTLIIIIVVGLLLSLFWRFLKRPRIFRNIPQDELIYHLKELFLRGYDKGFIVIRVPGDKKFKRFIQFAKYIESKKKIGLHLAFPFADWSKPYYEDLKSLLLKENIQFEIEKTGEVDVAEFLIADIRKDMEKGQEIAQLILQKIFGLDSNDKVELFIENINPRDEWVGFS